MSNGKKLFLALVALVTLGLPALAEERKGTITGRVTDSRSATTTSIPICSSMRKVACASTTA